MVSAERHESQAREAFGQGFQVAAATGLEGLCCRLSWLASHCSHQGLVSEACLLQRNETQRLCSKATQTDSRTQQLHALHGTGPVHLAAAGGCEICTAKKMTHVPRRPCGVCVPISKLFNCSIAFIKSREMMTRAERKGGNSPRKNSPAP